MIGTKADIIFLFVSIGQGKELRRDRIGLLDQRKTDAVVGDSEKTDVTGGLAKGIGDVLEICQIASPKGTDVDKRQVLRRWIRGVKRHLHGKPQPPKGS